MLDHDNTSPLDDNLLYIEVKAAITRHPKRGDIDNFIQTLVRKIATGSLTIQESAIKFIEILWGEILDPAIKHVFVSRQTNHAEMIRIIQCDTADYAECIYRVFITLIVGVLYDAYIFEKQINTDNIPNGATTPIIHTAFFSWEQSGCLDSDVHQLSTNILNNLTNGGYMPSSNILVMEEGVPKLNSARLQYVVDASASLQKDTHTFIDHLTTQDSIIHTSAYVLNDPGALSSAIANSINFKIRWLIITDTLCFINTEFKNNKPWMDWAILRFINLRNMDGYSLTKRESNNDHPTQQEVSSHKRTRVCM